MAIASVDSRVKKFKNLYSDSMNKDLTALKQTADAQKKVVTDTYNKSINDTKSSYNEQQQLNEVQRYINEREIAENMANAGLKESGLNDTQRTANQLSYANNKAKIDRALTSAVDNFRLEMNSKLTDIENNRISGEASIRQNYDSAALKAAQDEYDTEYKAETDRYKASLNAQTQLQKAYISAAGKQTKTNLINVSGGLIDRSLLTGTLQDHGIDVKIGTDKTVYTDKVTGKSTTLERKQNPFTGTINPDTSNGTFSNGYQPDNYKEKKLKDTGVNTPAGQNVWKYQDGKTTKYAIWNGANNKYEIFTKSELKQYGITV